MVALNVHHGRVLIPDAAVLPPLLPLSKSMLLHKGSISQRRELVNTTLHFTGIHRPTTHHYGIPWHPPYSLADRWSDHRSGDRQHSKSSGQ